MSHAPLALALPLALVLLMLAVPAGVAGLRGRAGGLDRRGRLGLHTPAAQYSDEAFVLANRVASPLLIGAAAVGALCAVLALALPVGAAGAIVIAALGLVGLLGQLGAATRLGERAARTVPLPARKPEGSSCCGGCDCGDGACAAGASGHGAAVAAIPDLVPDATLR